MKAARVEGECGNGDYALACAMATREINCELVSPPWPVFPLEVFAQLRLVEPDRLHLFFQEDR